MSAVIDNDYQTNLLFKQFTGVAATQLDQQFSNEPYRAIKNIFSRDIFIEEVPTEAPIGIFTLDNSNNWNDSIGTNPSVNGSGSTYSQLFPDTHIEFYKNIELSAVPGSNSRVWYKLDSSGNNILADTLNFKFDDINSTYLMRVKYNNGTIYINNPINSFPLFWVLDNQSGYLQLYATTAQLLSNANIPTNPPKISYFRYIGKKGLLNLDISGQQQVIDISGLNADISNIDLNLNRLNRMILPDGYVDISGTDYDLCGNEVVRTYYTYNRKNMFIGYENLPILDGSAVNHSQDPSHNNITYILDVSGNSFFYGNIDLSCNKIQDISGLYFCDGTFIGQNTTSFDISTNQIFKLQTDIANNILIGDGGNETIQIDFTSGLSANFSTIGSRPIKVENVSHINNEIIGLGRLRMTGGNVTQPSITFESDQNTGFFQNAPDCISVSCSGELILSLCDTSGINVYTDISMNANKITNIADAIDVSGVPSWGQVQQAIIDGSGGQSYWLQSGTSIYYNTGNVGIGTSNPNTKLEVIGDVSCGDLILSTAPQDLGSDNLINLGINASGLGSSGVLRVNTNSGILDIGPRNATTCHMETDVSNFQFNKDMTVTTGNITSGFSGGQFQNLTLSTDTFNTPHITCETGIGVAQVGIGNTNPAYTLDVGGDTNLSQNAFVSKNTTQSMIAVDKNLYARNTNLLDTLKITYETFYNNIWRIMIEANKIGTYVNPGSGTIYNLTQPNPGKPNAVPTFSSAWGPCVIPIAYLDINQNYIPTPFAPAGGQIYQGIGERPYIANTCAYFTIKFAQPYDNNTTNPEPVDWKTASLYVQNGGTLKSGFAAITQQTITFLAGYTDNFKRTPGDDYRKPKPFIKVISTNIPNLKCLNGITTPDGVTAIDINLVTQNIQYYGYTPDTPKIGGLVRIIIAEGCPGVPADKSIRNKAWLLIEQQWNVEPWQFNAVPPVDNTNIIHSLVGDHIIDVRMYANNLGDLNQIRNPPFLNQYNTDWQLVTEKSLHEGQEFSWDKFVLPMGTYAIPSIFNTPTIVPPTDVSFTLMVGGTPCPNPFNGLLDGIYPQIILGANLWEVWLTHTDWPYGITTTYEVFENNVDICGNVIIDGSTDAQAITATDITCNNLDALNSIDVGPGQKLRITENNIISTVTATNWAPNPGGSGSFNPGLEFEAENFYFDCGNGTTRGFIISLGDNTSNTIFRIVDNNNNYQTGSGLPPLFQVEGSGYTQTQTMVPWIDMCYNLGSSDPLRYKNLYIGNIDTSGNVDISGNLAVDGTVDISGDITVDGDIDICGNIDISGSLTITDISATNISVSNNLDVSNNIYLLGDMSMNGILIAPTIKNIDFSGTNIDLATTGIFRLKDNNTGAAANHVIDANSTNNKVNFGGYDYTGGTNIIGTPTARDRVIVDLEAGSTQFGLNVADSGSVIQTLGGIKILPLQTNANGAPPNNYVSPGWGSSIFLGEWGWGNQSWNNLSTIRLSQRTHGQNYPGSGNVYCNAVRQNIVYTNSNSQGPIWNPGYQGPTSNTMYYNQGDIRYIVVDPRNGTGNRAQVTLPTIQSPMLGQAITVTRANVPTTYPGYKTAVYVQADTPDRISCPNSIFVDGGSFGGIALDPFNDISGNSSVVLPVPYKGTEICSVTLVASQNGYYTDIPTSGGAPQGGDITTQFVWQFISSGSPGA